MNRADLRVGQVLESPRTKEKYEVTALGKRYLLVEVKTQNSAHEFPRRYAEVESYTLAPVGGSSDGN